jgi:enolase-phosphatase E1
MSRLRIFDHADPSTPLFASYDPDFIATELHKIGVLFERWKAGKAIAPGAAPEDVMDAYRADIDRLVTERGFKSVDVVSIAPDHPARAEMRTKFLDEHFHKEDEVRFFVAGSGLFTLHVEDKVYEIECVQDDLIAVPDGTKHWFEFRGDPFLHRGRWLGRALHRRDHRRDLSALYAGPVALMGTVVQAILTDIEGTTSSISFVKDVLFPYARRELPAFVAARGQEPDIRQLLDAVAAEAGGASSDEAIIEMLQDWIDQDRKHTVLKALQGLIWEAGYREADFTSHMYPDAGEALQRWYAEGLALYVYSSGSVPAQKLLFGHSDVGDLTPLFSGWFDTEVGGKREAASYARIVERIGMEAAEILFLSDVVAELDAAREAGLQTVLVDRLDDYAQPRTTEEANGHPRVTSFGQIVPAT